MTLDSLNIKLLDINNEIKVLLKQKSEITQQIQQLQRQYQKANKASDESNKMLQGYSKEKLTTVVQFILLKWKEQTGFYIPTFGKDVNADTAVEDPFVIDEFINVYGGKKLIRYINLQKTDNPISNRTTINFQKQFLHKLNHNRLKTALTPHFN